MRVLIIKISGDKMESRKECDNDVVNKERPWCCAAGNVDMKIAIFCKCPLSTRER